MRIVIVGKFSFYRESICFLELSLNDLLFLTSCTFLLHFHVLGYKTTAQYNFSNCLYIFIIEDKYFTHHHRK